MNNFDLTREIEKVSIDPIVDWIKDRNSLPRDHRPGWLSIVIDSIGGELDSAFHLADAMRSSEISIRTIGKKTVASAATLVFVAGHERILADDAQFIVHEPSKPLRISVEPGKTVAEGNLGLLQAEKIFRSLNADATRMTDHYVKYSRNGSLSSAMVRQNMLVANQGPLDLDLVIGYGLADKKTPDYTRCIAS